MRLLLVGLNVLAVCVLPVATHTLEEAQRARIVETELSFTPGADRFDEPGVVLDGKSVCNITPSDAQGQPLTGVQLFDQAGRPLDLRCPGQADRMVPWVLGDVTRWNVFPLGERVRPARGGGTRSDLTGAAFPVPERPSVPPVTNPLVVPDPVRDAGDPQKGRSPSTDRRPSPGAP